MGDHTAWIGGHTQMACHQEVEVVGLTTSQPRKQGTWAGRDDEEDTVDNQSNVSLGSAASRIIFLF